MRGSTERHRGRTGDRDRPRHSTEPAIGARRPDSTPVGGRRVAAGAAAVALALVAGIGSGAAAQELRLRPAALPEAYFQARLAELGPLLRPEELAAFARLEGDRRRLDFLDAVWRARDPTPATPPNEARREHEARLRLAYERVGGIAATDPDDARLRLIGLLGDPDEVLSAVGPSAGLGAAARSPLAAGEQGLALLEIPAECPTPPVEVFVYHPRGDRPALLAPLVRTDAGWRLHDGGPSIDGEPAEAVLSGLRRRRCEPALGRFAEALERALERPATWERALDLCELPAPAGNWLADLRAGSPVVTGDGVGMPEVRELRAVFTSRRVELIPDPRSPGRLRRDSAIDVEAQLVLEHRPGGVAGGAGEPGAWRAMRLRGEVFARAGRRSGLIVHRFAQDRMVPSSQREEVAIPFAFSAPPGDQLLVLEVADGAGEWSVAAAFELPVPLRPSGPGETPAAEGDGGLLARLDRMPALRLRLPGALLVGERPVQAITRGEVARVEYRLDGGPPVAADAEPFEAVLDFGALPIERSLVAVAFDAAGRTVAVDRAVVNPGLQRLRLDLVEVGRLGNAVRVRARLTRPVGSRLEGVEWFVDDRLVAVTTTEPLVAILPLPEEAGPPRFVRTVARLDDGRAVEDIRFLDSEVLTERVEVDLVQLFVRAIDRRGRRIEDLGPGEVAVLERGEPRTVRTFERATDLPLQLALLVDVSGTMARQIELVRAAAQAFLERLLREGDQGSILSFRTAPDVIAPFGPSPEWMSGALTRFQAWGGTALWDSIALTAYYAQGLPGKKAIVVVTDGRDQHSTLRPRDVEELAQRFGVAIHAIGLGIAPPTQTTLNASTVDRRRAMLDGLCERTGGRFHAAVGERGLTDALEAIERDLRSQYVLTFQGEGEEDGFRSVEVRVSRPGVRASTMSGYWP